MRKIIIAAALAFVAVTGVAVAETCYTDCWTDLGGNQHCTTRCSQY